jgi:hypothetical protein
VKTTKEMKEGMPSATALSRFVKSSVNQASDRQLTRAEEPEEVEKAAEEKS